MENTKINIKAKFKGAGKELISGFGEFFRAAIITAVAVIIITNVFILNAVIPSGSMDPTLPTNSLMICSRVDYWRNSPERGDIIVFKRNAEDKKTAYTKRVVGLPGDTVTIKEGITYVNDELYPEPWLSETPETLDFGPYVIPTDKYFCLGDNRNASNDSRYWDEVFVDSDKVLARGRILINPAPFAISLLKY